MWNPGNHTVVLGAEAQKAKVTSTIDYFDYGIYLGPEDNEEQNWAVYLNDTIQWGNFSITPGVRYDDLDFADNRLSPSFGLTYKLSSHTLLRGVVARGFRKPTIGLTQPNVIDEAYGYQVSNPKLEAEEVNSFQVGLETSAMGWCWLKGTFFLHQVDNAWVADPATDIWYNDGKSLHKGVEGEIKTVPWHDLSLQVNATYVHIDPDAEPSDTQWVTNVMLRYDDPQLFTVQLLGHYVNYGPFGAQVSGSDEDMIWDLHLSKTIPIREKQSIELFGIGHNLFNGRQTWIKTRPNPDRWFEVGARLLF